MRARRAWASAAVAVMVAAGVSLATAPTASSAAVNLDLSGFSGSVNGVTVAGVTFSSASSNFSLGGIFVDGEGTSLTMDVPNGNSVSLDARDYGNCSDAGHSIRLYSKGAEVGSFTVPAGCDVNSFSLDIRFDRLVYQNSANGGGAQAMVSNIAVGTAADTAPADAPPIPDWIQGYARASADELCIDGWKPSWDQWPNGGTGGYTCGRALPAFG